MTHAENEDWPIGQIIVVPHAWRGDDLWHSIQHEAQLRIGTNLRQMYADLLQQPLSPGLIQLVHEIEVHSATSRHDG